jgi:hypothetical protein
MSTLVINDLQQTAQFAFLSDLESNVIIGGGDNCGGRCFVICIPRICIPIISITWKCFN